MPKRGAGKTVDHYVDILKRAFDVAWSHKTLWVLGLFAGIVHTGSIFTTVVRTVRRIEPADELSKDIVYQAIDQLPWLLQYVRNLILFDTTRIILTIAVFLFVLALVTLVVLGSQQLLITGLHQSERRMKHHGMRKLLSHIDHIHVARLFAINGLARIAILLLLVGASLPIATLLSDNGLYNVLVYAAFYLLLIPLAFTIDSLSIFTMIRVVRKGDGLGEAFGHSYHLLKNNWLTALEVGVLLYIVNLLAPLLFFLIAVLIAVFTSVIGFASLSTGSALVLAVVTVVALVVVLALLLAATGFIVTFNYGVWLHLMAKLERRSILPTIEHVAQGFLRRLKRLA